MEGEHMPRFPTPKVHLNYNGWGPTTLPEQFLDVPYAPFGKGDRLGKAADFTGVHLGRHRYYGRRDDADVGYKYDDDMSFQLVDTSKNFRPKMVGRRAFVGRNRKDFNKMRQQRQQAQMGKKYQGQPRSRNERLRRGRYPGRRRDDRKVDRAATVDVQADWKEIDVFELPQLTKLQANVPEVEDLKWAGALEYYDDSYDRVSARAEKPLERIENREFFYVTTTDDPNVEEFATNGDANVFCTDAILAHLMASPRSVFPWDIVAQRVGNSLFFDKRDNSQFDYVTVNETSQDPPANDDPESINHPDRLSVEATAIIQNFSQQILNGKEKKFDSPNPFFDEEEAGADMRPAAIGYRYRRWNLGSDVKLIVRSELSGVMQKRGEERYFNAYALNQWDPKISGNPEWRRTIDAQGGAVLAAELKNNACKLAKWTAQSILSGADQMLIGFVTRKTSSDAFNHSVIGTKFHKPSEFAKQINLRETNMWGIIKMLVDKFMQQPEGKYVIMREPNKPVVHIYSVPSSTFEYGDDDEEDEDEEEDEENEEEGDEE